MIQGGDEFDFGDMEPEDESESPFDHLQDNPGTTAAGKQKKEHLLPEAKKFWENGGSFTI